MNLDWGLQPIDSPANVQPVNGRFAQPFVCEATSEAR